MADRDPEVDDLAELSDTAPADATSWFAVAWADHYPKVLAYARRRTSEPVASEVANATLLILWRRIEDPPADPLPWLYAVARKELANHRRGDQRRSRLVARMTDRLHKEDLATTPDVADTAVDAITARAALSRLGRVDREALMLVAWEGLGIDQAAESMGVSTDAFGVRLHRARRRLESQLSKLSKESEA